MVVIKNGFDDKPLNIIFDASYGNLTIGVNIEQVGLNTGSDKVIQRYETLSYASLNEIIELRNELNKVIAEVVGL